MSFLGEYREIEKRIDSIPIDDHAESYAESQACRSYRRAVMKELEEWAIERGLYTKAFDDLMEKGPPIKNLHIDPIKTPVLFDNESWAKHSLRALVVSRLGGVGALSPELYEGILQEIAKCVGCVVDSKFRSDVRDILASLPCPLD